MKKILFMLLSLLQLSTATFSQDVPPVKLFDLAGKPVSSEIFNSKNDQPIVLSFWATWCIPCINELTAINNSLDQWKKESVFDFYAIAVDDDRTSKRIPSFVNGKGFDFKVLIDKNQELKRLLKLDNIPYTLIIKNGKIIYRQLGYVPGDEKLLFKAIKEHQ